MSRQIVVQAVSGRDEASGKDRGMWSTAGEGAFEATFRAGYC